MASSVMAVFFSLRGRSDLKRWLCLLQNKTWQRGLVTSESRRRGRGEAEGWGVGEGGGIMPESNPPAGRLRTKNLFSTSGVTFY